MKIILSSSGFFPQTVGGGQVYVYGIARELLQRGHEVKVLTSTAWNGGENPYDSGGYDYQNIPVLSFSVNPHTVSRKESHVGYGDVTSRILRNMLQEMKPDVVHINGMKPALTVTCKDLNIPHLITAHHMGIACPAGGLLRPDYSICDKPANSRNCVPCCCYSKASKWFTGGVLGHTPPWVYRPIGKTLNRVKNLSYLGRGLIYPWLIEQLIESEKILLSEAQLFVAPSKAIKELLIRNGCDASKIVLIPHGIEPVSKVPFEPFANRSIRFGYLGRIDRPKGLQVILRALELIPERDSCELHIFGAAGNPWDEEYYTKALTQYRGRAKVVSHGLVHHNQIEKAFSRIDVLIVPSLLPEAFGMVVQESFSAGRPVIVSDVGGLNESVRNGVDGFIVERNNSQSLAEAMSKFVRNTDLIREMSNEIPSVKTTQQYTNEIEELYKNIVGSA